MINEKKAVWQVTIGLVLAAASLGVSPALAKHRPRPARPCAGGRYVVKGRALLASDTPAGEDAVVLSIPGAAEGAPPAIAIASGCPESPVTLETRKGGTRVRAVLTGCAGGDVTLRGRLDASCRIMRGRLRARAGGGRAIALRHHFTAELNGGFAGRVLGTVTARHGESSFPLPDMQVFLMRRADPTPSAPSVQSDDAGRFVLAADAGEYDLCASGNGFLLTCSPEPVRFGADLPDAVARNVEITLTGGAVHGRVLLADGSPCYQAPNPLDGGVVATVSHDGTSVMGTASGGYLLAGLSGPGSYTLTATCGSARVSRTVDLGADELSGAKGVDLTIPNTPPRIDLLAASQNGRVCGRRRPAPWSTSPPTSPTTTAIGCATPGSTTSAASPRWTRRRRAGRSSRSRPRTC